MLIQSIDPPETPHPSPLQPQPRRSRAQPPMVYVYEPLRWEYRTIVKAAGEPPFTDADLNAFGADGWELVGVAPLAGRTQLFFKRAVR